HRVATWRMQKAASALRSSQQRGKLFGGHRSADQVALNLVAALFAEEVQLRLGFDAFGHYLQLQAMHHGNDRADDGRIISELFQLGDEGTVDLDEIHRETLEVAE